jgi:HK97 family phage major capsid protein
MSAFLNRKAHLPRIALPTNTPRGLIHASVIAAEQDVSAEEVLRGIASAVDGRLKAVEADVDRMTNRWASQVAASGPSGARPDPRSANPNVNEYRAAFHRYFRHGEGSIPGGEAALRDLEVKAALSVGSNPDGGWTVLPEMDQQIDSALSPVSPMRSMATVMQIGSAEYKKLVNTSRNATGWVGETDVRTATQNAKFNEMRFPAQELYSMPAATQSLLDDSFIDIGAWLTGAVTDDFAAQEGNAFIAGNGVMKPFGIIGGYQSTADDDYDSSGNRIRAWGKLQYVPAGATSPSSDQLVATLVSMTQKLGIKYRANASWAFSRDFGNTVRGLKDSTGKLLFSDNGRLVSGLPETLLGFPINWDDSYPGVSAGANAIVAAFGDFKRGYLIVDRMGSRVLRDPYTSKPDVLFYCTKRVGGGVQNFEAIKLLKLASS